jgi:hypothetical protein
MHALAKQALDLCRPAPGGGLVLDDRAVDVLADGWRDAVGRGEAFDVAEGFVAAAVVLLERPEGKAAGRTLMALVLAAQPGLQALDAARAKKVQEKSDDAARAFAAFAGDDDDKAKKVLDSGAARPQGTTAAGPLARFALVGQAPPKKP